MEPRTHRTERCWCGHDQLVPFSPDYLRCPRCESLVLASFPNPQSLLVSDDERDLYGRKYYETLVKKFGYPHLEERAVLDLPERCLHWLRAFLHYKSPPGQVLEMGSAHGGFIALLRWIGFDATGLELSPWLVDFARRTFKAPVLQGPVEEQDIAPRSLDAIALMDVLEHLSDPVRTMAHCVSLIRNDGVVVIQTPCYTEGKTYERMLADNDRFLEHLKAEQHLYLFSRTSIQRLLHEVGAREVAFEKAIFEAYDMFLFASQSPLRKLNEQEVRGTLNANPSSRLIGALINLDDRARQIDENWQSAEADRAARLNVIEDQGRKLGEAEQACNLLAAELAATRAVLEAAEADRAARLNVIEDQGRKLGEAEQARSLLAAELEATRAVLEAAEADRAARLNVIEDQGRKLGEAEQARSLLAADLEATRVALGAAEADRAARLNVIEDQGRKLGEAEQARSLLAADLAATRAGLEAAEADRAARLSVIEDQGRKLGEAEQARSLLAAELAATRAGLEAAEADRAARLNVIEDQGRKLGEAEQAFKLLTDEVAKLLENLETAQRQLADSTAFAESLQSQNAAWLNSIETQSKQMDYVRNELSQLKRQRLVRLLIRIGLIQQ